MKRIALGKLASINRGLSWSLDQESSEPVSGSSPVLRIGNVQNKLDTSDLVYISKVSVEQKEKHKVGENSIVMVGSNGNHNRIGNCCIIKSQSDFLYASFLIGLVPYKDKIDSDFLYYVISSPHTQREITDSVTGSTGLANLSLSFLRELPIGIPDTSTSQTQIAAVLSCIDRAIEHTEALIAKQQRIKTGLMQDLLTKGIDEHGNIRSEATHEFKDSPLGRIPKEWEVSELETLYKTHVRDFGSFSSTKEITFLDDGIPFIKSEMIGVGKIDWSGCFYISDEVHQKLIKSHVNKGNILFSKIGSALGKAVVYEGERGECNSNAAIAKIDIDREKADRYFVEYVLNFETTQRQLKNMIVSLLPRVNLGDINQIQVPIPSLNEQQTIAQTIVLLDSEIEFNQEVLSKQLSTKQGLMQDLLTGKVSVSGLLAESAAGIGQ